MFKRLFRKDIAENEKVVCFLSIVLAGLCGLFVGLIIIVFLYPE